MKGPTPWVPVVVTVSEAGVAIMELSVVWQPGVGGAPMMQWWLALTPVTVATGGVVSIGLRELSAWATSPVCSD